MNTLGTPPCPVSVESEIAPDFIPGNKPDNGTELRDRTVSAETSEGPSGLALLALGAGGILERRRRNKSG